MQEISWKNILIELLIVFVGVYGAFLLNSYREGMHADQARIKYYETFLSDLKFSLKRCENLKNEVDSTIIKVKGSETVSLPYNRDLDFTNTFYILQSAYSGENFTSINTGYLINIEFGSNLIKRIEKRFDILDAEVRQYKIYGKANADEADNFKQWYLGELTYLSGLMGKLIHIIESEDGAIAGTKHMIEELK